MSKSKTPTKGLPSAEAVAISNTRGGEIKGALKDLSAAEEDGGKRFLAGHLGVILGGAATVLSPRRGAEEDGGGNPCWSSWSLLTPEEAGSTFHTSEEGVGVASGRSSFVQEEDGSEIQVPSGSLLTPGEASSTFPIWRGCSWRPT